MKSEKHALQPPGNVHHANRGMYTSNEDVLTGDDIRKSLWKDVFVIKLLVQLVPVDV
jgi:hypothetical protein